MAGENTTKQHDDIALDQRMDYIADSRREVQTKVPLGAANALYLLLAVVVSALIWAYFAKIDEMAVADGRIIASSHLQEVQHYEGGIVKKIHVKEGDVVDEGTVLITLDNTRFGAEHQQGLTKLAVLRADEVRLSAQAEGKASLEFDPAFEKAYPKEVAYARQHFQREFKAIASSMALLDQSYQLMKRELDIVAPLAKQGVMSDVEKIRLERQLTALQNEILEKKERARHDSREQLNKVKGEIAILQQSITTSKDRMERTTMRSPVKGIVNQVYVSTVGEVVKPGDNVIEIVPTGDILTVQAFIRPTDIGFIHPGQKAIVKVGAYDFSTYGGLSATVETVGADAVTDKSGNSFYEVNLVTDVSELRSKDKALKIMPGMTVTVNILTGKKTIMTYLLKPLLRAKESALRER